MASDTLDDRGPNAQQGGSPAEPGGSGKLQIAHPVILPLRLERFSRRAFWIFWVLFSGGLGLLWTRLPDLHHGDSFSDANVINAGRNFDRVGMAATCGLPVWWCSSEPGRLGPIYTHYPPGPEWIHQALKFVGLHELWQWRLISISTGALALLALWWFALQIAGSPTFAMLAVLFYAVSAPFTQFADSIHQHTYMQLTLFGCLGAWCAVERAQTSCARGIWLTLAGLFLFLDLWLTFEHVAFIPAFIAGRTFFCGFRRLIVAGIVMGCVFGAALTARVLHNATVLGSVSAAVDDLFGAAKYRAAAARSDIDLQVVAQRWKQRLGGGLRGREDHDSAFIYPILKPQIALPCLILVPWACWAAWRHRTMRSALWAGLLLLAAGLIWFVLMKEHVERHRHVIMLLLPGLSVVLATLAVSGIAAILSRRRFVRIGGLVAAFTLIGIHLSEIRHARSINAVEDVHPRLFQRVHAEMMNLAAIRSVAAPALQHAPRVYFVGRAWPEQAAALGAPFEFVEREIPALRPGEFIWIETWTAEEKRLALEAARRYGPAEQLPPPLAHVALFRAGVASQLNREISFENKIILKDMRFCESTMAGRHTLGLRFELPYEEMDVNRCAWVVRLIDGEGREIGGKFDRTLTDGAIRSAQDLLMSISIDHERLKNVAGLRVGMTTIEGTPLAPKRSAVLNDAEIVTSGDGWSFLIPLAK